jgi:hypothetical protein
VVGIVRAGVRKPAHNLHTTCTQPAHNQQKFLSDPQQMNSYSYGRDNPITQKDPNGTVVTEAADLVYQLLYLNTGRTALESYGELVKGVAEGSPNQGHDQSQFLFDTGSLGASSLALFYVGNPVMAAAVDVGGVVLSIRDSYCSGHTCKNFGGGLKSISDILAGIPTGQMSNPTSMTSLPRPQGNGAPYTSDGSSNKTRAITPQAPSGSNSGGGGGGGGGAYQQLVGLYQSLVSTLSAYVSALSGSSNSGSKH